MNGYESTDQMQPQGASVSMKTRKPAKQGTTAPPHGSMPSILQPIPIPMGGPQGAEIPPPSLEMLATPGGAEPAGESSDSLLLALAQLMGR